MASEGSIVQVPGFVINAKCAFCPRPGLGPAVPWRTGPPHPPRPCTPPGPRRVPGRIGPPLQYTGPFAHLHSISAPLLFRRCSVDVPSMSRRCSVNVPSMSRCSVDPSPPLYSSLLASTCFMSSLYTNAPNEEAQTGGYQHRQGHIRPMRHRQQPGHERPDILCRGWHCRHSHTEGGGPRGQGGIGGAIDMHAIQVLRPALHQSTPPLPSAMTRDAPRCRKRALRCRLASAAAVLAPNQPRPFSAC